MAFGPIMRFEVDGLSIELSPFTKEVVGEAIEEGINLPSVQRFLGLHGRGMTLEDEQEWFERTRTDDAKIVWAIWVVEDGQRKLIGNSALFDITRGHIHQATSGSAIFRPEYWGKGIASAAHKARTWYAFHELGLHRIMSAVIQGNGGSLKALTRSGYNLVYTERNTVFTDGKLRHQDNLECLNPNDPFWSQWWNGETPTESARAARRLTRQALSWAEKHVELP